MDLHHRDYLGMYAAALFAILFFPAVGGLLVSMEAGLMILEALIELFGNLFNLGAAVIGTGLMFLFAAGVVQGVKEWAEKLGDYINNLWLKRKYPRLYSVALDLQSLRWAQRSSSSRS